MTPSQSPSSLHRRSLLKAGAGAVALAAVGPVAHAFTPIKYREFSEADFVSLPGGRPYGERFAIESEPGTARDEEIARTKELLYRRIVARAEHEKFRTVNYCIKLKTNDDNSMFIFNRAKMS